MTNRTTKQTELKALVVLGTKNLAEARRPGGRLLRPAMDHRQDFIERSPGQWRTDGRGATGSTAKGVQ